jgi:anti-sigma factor RsiW
MTRTMTCRRCRALLSGFVDGELEPSRAQAVARHVEDCTGCASVREELAALRDAVAGLRSAEPAHEGGGDAWEQLAARLDDAERAQAVAARAAARARSQRGFRLLVPSLALGLVMVVAGGASALRQAFRRDGTPASDAELLRDAEAEFSSAEAHYARAASDVRALALRERGRWSEERRRRFDAQLGAFEQATALRHALLASERAEHGRVDPEAEEQLFAAYREQIAFLEEAIAVSDRGGERNPHGGAAAAVAW